MYNENKMVARIAKTEISLCDKTMYVYENTPLNFNKYLLYRRKIFARTSQ